MAPVRYKCEREEVFPAKDGKPALSVDFCEWEVDAGVKAVKLECATSKNRYVITRNMDDVRETYPWRISRFDIESGEPWGHSYGASIERILNTQVRNEKCRILSVRTESGQGDFGRARFEKLTTTLNSSVPTREARRVVAAFLRGETARGACTGKREARKCAIVSRKNTLEVGGEIVASRDGRTLSVCVPSKATMEQRGKRQHETEAAKDVRVAASTLLRRVAGMAVRSDAEGQRLLAAGGRAALLMPGACVQVRIPKKQVARLMAAARVSEEAEARYNTEFPTQDQRAKAIRVLRAKQRSEALTKAQDKRRMRVGPAPVPLPEEEYAPEAEAPEAPLPEYAPVEYEAPAEDETFDFEPASVPETAAMLPTDVPNPTDPETFHRFETEFLAKMRPGLRRDAALAWRAYLLNPEGTRQHPAASVTIKGTSVPENQQRAARQIEIELVDRYGIIDPLHGFVPPDVARQAAAYDRGVRARAEKRAKKGVSRGTPEQREWMRQIREGGPGSVVDKREKAQWNAMINKMRREMERVRLKAKKAKKP